MKSAWLAELSGRRRLLFALVGVVVAAAVILPACGDIIAPGTREFAITKSSTANGQVITYTILVSNHSPTAAASGFVTDQFTNLPAGTALGAVTGATCTGSLPTLSCTTPVIQPGAGAQMTFAVTIPDGSVGDVQNCATLAEDSIASNNKACVANTVRSTTGSITIIKDAQPDDPQNFTFTSNNTSIPSFQLDDDTDPTLSNQKVFTGLNAGTYTITESATTGWNLGNIVCLPAASAAANVAGRSVAITVVGGGSVSCTFINKAGP
jgi:uncharacterized repeat protein (TIGR01451 family)